MQGSYISFSSHAEGLGHVMVSTHSLFISKYLKLFDISSSSSSLEFQLEVIESNGVHGCNLAKWHSFNSLISNELFGSFNAKGVL